MLYDFIIINKKDKTPLYRQIYMSVRKSIETGSLKKGTKLPSIRRLSTDLDVSKLLSTERMNSYVQRDIYQTGHEADIMLRHSSAVHRQKAIKCLQIPTKQKDTMNMISAVKALMTV